MEVRKTLKFIGIITINYDVGSNFSTTASYHLHHITPRFSTHGICQPPVHQVSVAGKFLNFFQPFEMEFRVSS